MCGLVGVAGNVMINHEKILKTLLCLDVLRGEDSTGLAAIRRRDGETFVAKQLGNPFELFNDKRFTNALQGSNKALIGHNRYATSGAVNRQNAHPFNFQNVVGAHNGTLKGKHRLLDAADFTVDSENLYHHIDQEGLDSALDVMEGAWALTWFDREDQTMNFLRNSERNLYFCRSEDLAQMFWASEAWMLDVALARHAQKRGEIYLLPEDQHWAFPIDAAGRIGQAIMTDAPSRFRPAPTVYPITPYRAQQQQGSYQPPAKEKVTTLTLPNLAEEKKSTGQVAAVKAPFNASLAQAKTLLLELVSINTDAFGSRYIECHSDQYEEKIRLYVNRNQQEFETNLGKFIIADINGYVANRKDVPFYKVAASSAALVEDDDLSMDDELLFKDHRGKLLTDKLWKEQYKQCAACDGYINPMQPHKFTASGECLCHYCAKDPEVLESVATV